MADELLDLVNKNDKVIGEVWKSEVNQNPQLIHREVAVIIYNDYNQVLFQKRSRYKKVNPGIWAETVAGHVGKGEKPINAAHRELKEELGFDSELKLFDKVLAKPQNETHFTYWYIGRFPIKTKITIRKSEVEKAVFLSLKELQNLIKSGEIYDPISTGGQPKDMVKEFWKKAPNKTNRNFCTTN